MDSLTPEQRRRNMQNIRSKDTSIEVIMRKALWKESIRYRKNYTKLPGKPDIAITKYKIAIFCDSEFWHGKDWEFLRKRLEKGSKGDYWVSKIQRNIERDEEINKKLIYLGWHVLRFWEKEIKKQTDICVQTVKEAIFNAKLNSEKDEYILN